MKLYDELIYRGFIDRITSDKLIGQLNSGSLTYYIGFDPTADSFHIGQYALFNLMRILSANGHKTIALMGGATGMIGDPSGKSKERVLKTPEDIQNSIAVLEKQFRHFLDFSDGRVMLKNNYEWVGHISFLDALRDIGKHFSVNMMLTRDSVSTRLNTEGEGITYTEFSYMLLQAYDYYYLNKHHHCDLQIGGSDQWGNIVSGIDLVRRLNGKEVYGLTIPLVTKSDGSKFGKSEKGTVWLDSKMTTPFDFYQFFIRQADNDVIRYLKIFTRLTPDRIAELELAVSNEPHLREAQRVLAEEVTRVVHGENMLGKIQRASEVMYGENIVLLEADMIESLFSEVAPYDLPIQQIREKVLLVDTAVEAGMIKSKQECRRLIANGGLYVNNKKVESADKCLEMSDLIRDKYIVLRSGKKHYKLLRTFE